MKGPGQESLVNSNRIRPACDAASAGDQDRKIRSLLQLGEIIGLDLQLDEMLLQIAMKAVEVMEADRFSIFLHDAAADQLYTTVALGMGRQEIRMAADSGIAGYCLKTGDTVILEDAQQDPRLNREIEGRTGYRTKSLLSLPFYSRAGRPLGVAQALNKRSGLFTESDAVFLRMFNNHAAVFIEMAQLQKARIQALEQSRLELERLSRAKSKAINHVSHELKTPLAVIKGNIGILKNRFRDSLLNADWRECIDSIERHLGRLTEIEKETRHIFQLAHQLEAGSLVGEMARFEEKMENFSEMSAEVHFHWDAVKGWLSSHIHEANQGFRSMQLYPFVKRVVKKLEERMSHRKVSLEVQGDQALSISMNSHILEELLDALVKNGVENTPDGGKIEIILEEKDLKSFIHVKDYGIGITEENRISLFDGLYPATETELYASKRPYDFGAGGKGLDLLRMKLYADRFGFSVSAESSRCRHLSTDRDECPGSVLLCGHCRTAEDCFASGGSTFTAAFTNLGGPSDDRTGLC